MKKFIKLILINLIILGCLLTTLEYIVYKQWLKSEIANYLYINKKGFIFNSFVLPVKNFEKAIKLANENKWYGSRVNFRTTIPLSSPSTHNTHKLSSILLYGCSYTWGSGLEEHETFSYKLQKYTNRLVYNRGLAGYGVQHMLYHIQYLLKDFSSTNNFIKPNIVIYTFIEDHIYRLYKPNDYFDIFLMYYKYDKNRNRIKKINDFDIWFWHSYILRSLFIKKYNKDIIINEESKQFLLSHFIEAKLELNKVLGNTKFVIFVYDGDNIIKSIEPELNKYDINIIYLSNLSNIDFTKKEYRLINDFHPNEKAWDVIVPLLAKKLNL